MKLKRWVPVLALLIFPKLAVAEWAPLPFGPPVSNPLTVPGTYYFDSQLIAKQGTLGRGSWMLTLDSPHAIGAYKHDRRQYLSQVAEGEFNCSTREYRLLTNRFYSGPNGSGELLRTVEGDSWRDLKDGYEIWSYVWQQVCK